MKKKLLIFFAGMATLVLLGAVYQNSFVTDPIANPLIITTPELANFASKSFVTNYVVSNVNPLTNFDTRTIVLSNTITMYGKLNANKQVETPVLFSDGATTLYSTTNLRNWVGISNNYAPLTINLASADHTNNASILFGDPLGNANGANVLFNATHDSPSGAFGGELQITAPSISLSGGADSAPLSSYHIGRRIQLGIGNNYRSWVDLHFDRDGSVNTSQEGTTLPLRWQIQSSNSVSIFPAIQGRAGDTIGGLGHAYLGFYDDFDTSISGAPNYDFIGGTLRGKMVTGKGWEFYGTNVMTNLSGNLTISGSYYGDGSHLTGVGGGSQTPWTTNINGAGFSLTNAGSVQVAGAGSGHLILSETNSGGYVDMFHSGTNLYVDVVGTNVAGALNTNHLTFGNNVSGNLIRLVGTNNTALMKLMQDGSFYLGATSNMLVDTSGNQTNAGRMLVHSNFTVVGDGVLSHPQVTLTNGASGSSIYMYGGTAGGTPSAILAQANGIGFVGTNANVELSLNDVAATFTTPALSISTSTNAPANNEFPVAGWVRSLFNSGIFDYATTNTAIGFTNADSPNQVVYQFTNSIPLSATRVWATAFLTNGGYVGSVVDTNRYTLLNGLADINAFIGLTSGGGDALSLHPELYYSYDGTNWIGDFSCQKQAITPGATNLYSFVVTFPQVTATNTTGFFVERRLKIDSVGGSPTMYFLVGTNGVSGTNNASHMAFNANTPTGTGSLVVQTNGATLDAAATTINFVAGANTTVTGAVSGATATIGISSTGGGGGISTVSSNGTQLTTGATSINFIDASVTNTAGAIDVRIRPTAAYLFDIASGVGNGGQYTVGANLTNYVTSYVLGDMSANIATGYITNSKPGLYQVLINAAFGVSPGGQDVVYLYTNDVLATVRGGGYMSAVNAGNAVSGYIRLGANIGSVVRFSNNFTLTNGTCFSLTYIGP